MHRWTFLLGAMLLVLMLWSGGAAHAAERFECIPATAEAIEHSEGDKDQVPSSPEQCVAHDHSGCNGDHLEAPASLDSMEIRTDAQDVPLAWREVGTSGRRPESQLRPPIA